MILLALALALAVLAGPAPADTARTLDLMAQVARSLPAVVSAKVEPGSRRLKITTMRGATVFADPGPIDPLLDQIADPAARRAEIARQIELLIDTAAAQNIAPASLDAVLPVIRPSDMAKAAGRTPVGRRFLAGLTVLYVLDTADTVAFLDAAALRGLDVTPDRLDAAARDNVDRLAQRAKIEVTRTDPFTAAITLDGFYEGSLLLAEPLWQRLVARHGPLAVAYPARDALAVTALNAPEAVEALRQKARAIHQATPYPVTPCLLRRTAKGWSWLDACS